MIFMFKFQNILYSYPIGLKNSLIGSLTKIDRQIYMKIELSLTSCFV